MDIHLGSPAGLRNVRLASFVTERSPKKCLGGGGWTSRYVVLSANFLLVYTTPTDPKPLRMLCVDDCTIVATPEFKDRPFAVAVATPSGPGCTFDPGSAEERMKWITAVSNAGYTSMYARTREAVKFLDRCKEVLAPISIALEEAEKGSGEGGAAGRAAAVEARRVAMTGADVVALLSVLSESQEVTTASLVGLRGQVTELEGELAESEAEAEAARAAAAAAESTATAAATAAAAERKAAEGARNEAAAAQEEAAHLSARVSELEGAIERVRAEGGHGGRAAGAGAGAGSEENAALRARVAVLEAAAAAQAAAVPAARKPSSAAPPPPSSTPVAPPPLHARSVGAYASPAVSASRAGGVGFDSAGAGAGEEWAPFLAEAQRLEREGNYPDAEQQYEAVLATRRERAGGDAAGLAAASRDLGRVLALQRRFEPAEEQYAAAVRLCASSPALGEAHPTTACALTDLAAVLREQSKFEAAEGYAARAVASLRAGVGPDDVSTATALYNLAGLSKRQGKFRAAEGSYMDSLRIFRERLGEGAGETADCLYQLGCLFRKRNELGRASSYFSAAAESYAQTYGPGDKRVGEAVKRAKALADKAGGTPSKA